MSKLKIGAQDAKSGFQPVEEQQASEAKGKDRQLRKVNKRPAKPFLKQLLSRRFRWRSRRTIAHTKPVITPYHKKTGQKHKKSIPSLNNRPFYEFWQAKDGARNFTDTVDHQVMKVRNRDGVGAPVDGDWHVKSPGKESGQTRFKRLIQKLVYHVTGQDYKGHYYDDHKLLVQKEVLATNLYRAVVLEDDNPDQDFEKEFQCGYSYDEKQDRHCVAIRHLDGFKDASTLFHGNKEVSKRPVFDDCHNPAADMVIRRFFLGDEDYLKLDNYMYKTNDDQQGRTRMYCIDFGMSFYNIFQLPKRCSYEQFKHRLLTKSRKHEVQYSGQPTMMTVIKQMSPGQVENGIRGALEKIARMSDASLRRQCWQVHNSPARKALLALLFSRRQQARAILDPTVTWPEKAGRGISDGLVARPDRRS